MKVLAVIPARSGSKGVPGKNKMKFDGIPLAEYSIRAALGSLYVNHVIVSSNDEEILGIAENFNSEKISIHRRPEALCTDQSPIVDTIQELLLNIEPDYEYVMILQPTAPLRKSLDLDQAIELIRSNSKVNTLVSVIKMDDIHPARMYWKDESKMLQPIMKEYESTRRQDIPSAYYRNGAIYITRISELKKTNQIIIKPTIAYEMPYETWLNIDDNRDVMIAEVLITNWNKNE